MITMLGIIATWTAAFAALNYLAVRKWRESWELARWTPSFILTLWDFYLIVDSASDSTSHNLWPIELIGVTMLSLIVLAVIAVAYDARTRWKR